MVAFCSAIYLNIIVIVLISVDSTGGMQTWRRTSEGELVEFVGWSKRSGRAGIGNRLVGRRESHPLGRPHGLRWQCHQLARKLLNFFLPSSVSLADFQCPKMGLEPSSLVEVTLGNETKVSPVKPNTVNPSFRTKFVFFIRHPEDQELKIEVRMCFSEFFLLEVEVGEKGIVL